MYHYVYMEFYLQEETRKPEKSDLDLDDADGSEYPAMSDPLSGFSSSVDLTQLESSTALTKRKLQDISLLLNPDALKTLL